jgi:hypothetical protein
MADRTRRIIRADGSVEQLDERLTMAEIRRRLGAQTLDTVQLRHLGRPVVVMIVDDSGHQKGLPLNAQATDLYLANCQPGTTHMIRGDVAVVPDSDFGSD